ncbi:Histidinol-phosphate aminotransferase [Trichinella spiralis]|uniref:Histidinol-phosphate aminotransferase n=1 Tax=Trichinella spiralis TaxID=6334 RepID=A0ABR3K184_TRISP
MFLMYTRGLPLKQAPRCWNLRLVEFLRKQDLKDRPLSVCLPKNGTIPCRDEKGVLLNLKKLEKKFVILLDKNNNDDK